MTKYERVDHFEKNQSQLLPGNFDWNFNICLGDQPEVVAEANRLQELVVDPYPERMHYRIPAEWLHVTVLRVGTVSQFNQWQMGLVAGELRKTLAGFKMPDATIDGWWQPERAVPMLDIGLKEKWAELCELVLGETTAFCGDNAVKLAEPYDAHGSLAYPRSYTRTPETDKIYERTPIEPITFAVKSLSLVIQYPNNPMNPDYYKWAVAEEIPIGTQS